MDEAGNGVRCSPDGSGDGRLDYTVVTVISPIVSCASRVLVLLHDTEQADGQIPLTNLFLFDRMI